MRQAVDECISENILAEFCNCTIREVEALREQFGDTQEDMGELFEHFEGWDVQALRQEIREAKEKAEREKEKAENMRSRNNRA